MIGYIGSTVNHLVVVAENLKRKAPIFGYQTYEDYTDWRLYDVMIFKIKAKAAKETCGAITMTDFS
jgi:hypothetical protein